MNKHNRIALLASTAVPLVFDGGNVGWKLDADGKIEMRDGNPVFIGSDGKEMTVATDTVPRLQTEARQHREKAEQATAALDKYKVDGKLIDPDTAVKAIGTVANIDAKKLIDAGELETVKAEVARNYTTQITEKDQAIAERDARLNQMTLERAFDRSKFIAEKIAVPPDMFRQTFGGNFKIEDGKPIPYDANGNKIYSPKRAGEVADVDEALEIIVNNYAYRDNILKAPPGGGSGGNGGSGGGSGGTAAKQIRRAEYDAMSPADQAATGAKLGSGELTMVD